MQGTSILSVAKKYNPYLVFLFVCLLLYLPSSFLRGPFYPDEIRNIYIARNMFSLEDFLLPEYLGAAYHEKPPLYFWFLKPLTAVPGVPLLFFPTVLNVLLGWALLSLNYSFFKREGRPEAGFLASLLLSTVAIFYGMSMLARMDIMFLLFTYLGIYCLWRSRDNDSVSFPLLAALAGFLAVFTKGGLGLIVLFLSGAGAAVLLKDRKFLIKTSYVCLSVLALIGLWLFAFTAVEPEYFRKMFFEQTVSRAVSPAIHKEHAFFYVPFLFVLFLPWTFLGIGYLATLKKKRPEPFEKMFGVWFVATVVVLSLIRSKLPMYLLIVTVPFSAFAAKFLLEGPEKLKRVMLQLTAWFFFFSWVIAFIIFKAKGEFIHGSAWFALVLFVLALFLMFRKSASQQFTSFFVVWVLVIQMMNLSYVPLASNHSKFSRIAAFLKKADAGFQEVVVTEKPLLQLSIYNLGRPVIYVPDPRDACKGPASVIISKKGGWACPVKELTRIGGFHLYEKTGD